MTQFKKGLFTRNLLATAILAPMMIVAGCSDNDGSPLPSGEVPGEVTSGVAYDGYLVGAKVCVDRNLNKACDSGEPDAQTEAGGKFDIVGLTDEDLLKPLVLEADEDTFDEDAPGEPVAAGLKYSAPAGSTAVSGLSTIIQSKIEQLIASDAEGTLEQFKRQATNQLANELGLKGVDLTTYDPIAVSESENATEAEKEAAAKAHLINQVVTQQIAKVSSDAAAVAGTESTATYVVAVRAVEAAVQNVVTAVEKYDVTDSTTTLETITTEIGEEGAPATPTAEEIQTVEEEYAQIVQETETKVEEEVNEEPTGATGGTGS